MDFGLIETRSRLTAAAAGELECMLESLFENPIMIPNTGMASVPVIGGPYIVALDHSHFLPVIGRALCAKEKFRQEAPCWPDLPLRAEDCEALENADDVRLNVLGYYGDSQRTEYWNPHHPSFRTFVRGLMAYEHTPIELRTDPWLQQLFPPCPLEGMCDGWLTWRSPETLAQHRRLQQMIAEHEALKHRDRGPHDGASVT